MRILKVLLRLFFLFILLLFSVTTAIATISAAPYVPSRRKDLERIKKMLKIKEGDVIYELGSGDGRLCLYLAKNSQARRIVGIELSFFYYLLGKAKILYQKLNHKVEIHWGNFFTQDLRCADKIFFYLTSRTANRISNKLLQELREGTIVISYMYPITGWQWAKKDEPSKEDAPIYEYRISKGIQKVVFDG